MSMEGFLIILGLIVGAASLGILISGAVAKAIDWIFFVVFRWMSGALNRWAGPEEDPDYSEDVRNAEENEPK